MLEVEVDVLRFPFYVTHCSSGFRDRFPRGQNGLTDYLARTKAIVQIGNDGN